MTDPDVRRPGRQAFSVADLTEFAVAVLARVGMRSGDAATTARCLVDADAGGIHTHGVSRLPSYVAQLESGQVNPRPNEQVVSEGPASLLVDADSGFGAPVGVRVIEAAVEKAQRIGVAVAGVVKVAHFGAAGFYTRHAADRGCLALAFSSSSPTVVPFGGRGPRIGNSPLSFASPGTTRPELVVDMAQSMSSRGRVKVALEAGDELPSGWAVDEKGEPTRDPAAALAGGILTSGGHKGSALSLMVEMLASGLTGANLTQDITLSGFTGTGGNAADAQLDVTVGNLYLVVDADVFGDAFGVRARTDAIADHVRASEPAPGVGKVRAPGDLEAIQRSNADMKGIALPATTVANLNTLADRYAIRMPVTITENGS